MDPSTFLALRSDDDTKALDALLQAFGPVCSLEEIASAYCKAGRDVSRAGDVLYQLQECKSHGAHHVQNGEMSYSQSEESLGESITRDSAPEFKNSKGSKTRKLTASIGSVSGVLGKTYLRPSSTLNESFGKTKPLKLEMKEPLIDGYHVESVVSDFVPRKEALSDKDVEEFLYSMLGDGFKLGMDVIQEALGRCGYDIKKSMDELLALSTKNLKKGKAINLDNQNSTCKCQKTEPCLSEPDYSTSPSTGRKIANSSSLSKEKSNLSREVLEALFSAPERSEEEPVKKRLVWGLNRTRVVGQKVVTEPLDELALPPSPEIPNKKSNIKDVEEDNYEVLRRAAKQHWDVMKAYYEAAADAFTKGDDKQVRYLLEQGKYHNQKAREADEKSAREIVEPRKTDTQDGLTLDLHNQRGSNAVGLLKVHLQSLGNIPSFRYLKVILDGDATEITEKEIKRQEKRKQNVMELLEKESIKWAEEEGIPGTIVIQLDQIDPKKLSFVSGQ